MDDDHRELVRRVFASATELIETAHDAAVAGQSGEIAAIAVIAEAATIVANLGINQHRNQRPHHR